MKQCVNVDDSPQPRDEEKPSGSHYIVLPFKLSWRHVVFLKDVLIEGDVSIPGRGANEQLNRKVSYFAGDFLGCDFNFVYHTRL